MEKKLDIGNYSLAHLVKQHRALGALLHEFGIPFYENSQEKLRDVCERHGIDMGVLLLQLEAVSRRSEAHNLKLFALPLDLLVEYLKHAHHLFIKSRLPYISSLIKTMKAANAQEQELVDDLRFVFPLFLEDFIRHIYEEEDNLFAYIHLLLKTKSGKVNPGKVFYLIEQYSLQTFALEHEEHDDEMEGLSQLVTELGKQQSPGLRVVAEELNALQNDLIIHASVEDEILFPKALMLEKEVKKLLRKKAQQN